MSAPVLDPTRPTASPPPLAPSTPTPSRRWHARLVPALGLCLALSGCGPSDVGRAPAEVERWTLAEDLRYPDAEAAPLTSVEVVTPAPDGRIYVVDQGTPQVLVFASDGAFERTLGREGEGPGEFRRPWRVGVVGDTVWAIDSRLDRLSLFAADGSFLGSLDVTRDVELPDSLINVTPWARLADGSLLVGATPPAAVVPGRPDRAERLYLFRVGEAGRPRAMDTLDVRHQTAVVALEGGWLFGRQPLSDSDLVRPSPYGDGWAIVEQPQPAGTDAASYSVGRFGAGGNLRFRAEVPYRPVVTSGEDVEEALDKHDESVAFLVERGLFASEAEARAVFAEALYRPEYLPPVQPTGGGLATEAVRLDDRGRVWVHRVIRTEPTGPPPARAEGGARAPGGTAGEAGPGDSDRSEPNLWDLVGADGRIAQLVVPAGSRLMAVRGDHAWGVVVDEFDVPTIVRYRIMGG